jgi:hypothetical protein
MSMEIIDPAWEAAKAIRALLKQKPSAEATWKHIKRAVGDDISTEDFWELIAALRSRLARLGRFASEVSDNEFSEEQRTRVHGAINTCSATFEPQQLGSDWQTTVSNFVRADDALQLEWFSIVAKRHQPLRLMTDVDRKRLIEQIDEVLEHIKDRSDVPNWAQEPHTEGLRRFRLILQHLLFFGCAEAIDQLMDLYQKTTAVASTLDSHSSSKPSSNWNSLTIGQVLNFVVIAAALLCSPDQVTTAFERYKGWYISLVKSDPRLPSPEQRLLPPPSPTDDHGPEMPRIGTKDDPLTRVPPATLRPT